VGIRSRCAGEMCRKLTAAHKIILLGVSTGNRRKVMSETLSFNFWTLKFSPQNGTLGPYSSRTCYPTVECMYPPCCTKNVRYNMYHLRDCTTSCWRDVARPPRKKRKKVIFWALKEGYHGVRSAPRLRAKILFLS
jgi:hypothetical protein